MKYFKRLIGVVLSIAVSVSALAVSANAAVKAEINKDEIIITVGEKVDLYINKATSSITWSSDNEKVATVDGGVVTGVKAGIATVTAKHKKQILECEVTVVDNISIKSETKKMKSGEIQNLKLSGNTSDLKVKWSTSNSAVLSVNSSGVVYARTPGKAKVYATVNKKKYSVTITVTGTKPVSVLKYNGKVYALYDKYDYTWKEASEFCEEAGGHLVTITSEKEQAKIESLLADGTKNAYWIGGKRKSDGSFKWVTNEKFEYSNWAKRQPDNYTYDEDYIQIYKNENPKSPCILGQWNDLGNEGECNNEDFFGKENMGFICEWE